MRIRSCLLLGHVFLLAVAGCAAPVESGDEIVADGDGTGGKADSADRVLTEADNGAIIEVTEGTPVVLRLASNPTTGYDWSVTSTDRTFGYPAESFEASRTTLLGAGGTKVLRWETDGVLSQVGEHSVRLEYRRPWETDSEPADVFEFTVVVNAREAAAEAVVINDAQDGATVDVVKGADVQLRLESNPTTGYSWYITRTDRSFGYPSSTDFESSATDPMIVGAGGTQVLTWETGSPFASLGRHTVELKYSRGEGGDAARTFLVTINLIEAAPEALEIATSEENDGKTFEASAGQDIVVRVRESAFHGISWRVLSTDRSFGYPEETYEMPPPGLLDGPTTKVLTWHTNNPFALGSHTVVLESTNRTGETSTFTFTVNVSE